ncbi:Oidioi.mRNA.OKI2018_I69.XSR.g15989.t1.cds [Oikopleura dioica]|uniref:Oidioi.mRNA.OKI2018_I69.XSR.g15989.t1.cds n=1 Tax=Oikopleura dioica TaxID=34765 RepID=A0ABN7SLY4_OIKDI|nr:Oidioi.mRNA.OKI2018_I69.XSR.g15989.t1.cds [Oikopleura dioica]
MRFILFSLLNFCFLGVDSESIEKARIRRMLEDRLRPRRRESTYQRSSEILHRSPRKMDKRIRPFEDIAPLNVSINLFISSFDSIAETTMDFGLTFIMRLRWQDPRMMFPDITNEKTYNNRTILTMDLKFLDELWVPDVFFANEKSANVHQITSDNKRLRIDSAGYIYLEMRLSATLSCHMRFEHFPMDVQVCAIEIESFAYDTADVNFDWDSTPGGVELARSIELPQFKLQGHVLGKCDSPRGNFTCIEGKFILSRQMGYYLIQAYVPTTLIVMLSWISFWISINATPARVSGRGCSDSKAINYHFSGRNYGLHDRDNVSIYSRN